MRPTNAILATFAIAATAVLGLGVAMPAAAAPVLSATAAVKTAAEPGVVRIRCWTGWGWSAAGFAGALRPGILAVGSFYNSMAYGYSGAPQYYGERYPPYYTCDLGSRRLESSPRMATSWDASGTCAGWSVP